MCRKANRKSQKLSPLYKIAEYLKGLSSPLSDRKKKQQHIFQTAASPVLGQFTDFCPQKLQYPIFQAINKIPYQTVDTG